MAAATRLSHRYDGELVLFHIGMRINRWWRFGSWLPVFFAMPRMLRELATDPESGMMGYRLTFAGGGPLVVQYWNSLDKLYTYASRPDAEHRPAWTRFNAFARKHPGVVGIYHETFVVERAETMYAHMPAVGLGAATEAVPVGAGRHHARERVAQGRTGASAGTGAAEG
jgi:hypothetical protein